MSDLVLHESTDMDVSSSDDELSDFRKEDMEFARNMICSKSLIDRRLLTLYKLDKAHRKVQGSGVEYILPAKNGNIDNE